MWIIFLYVVVVVVLTKASVIYLYVSEADAVCWVSVISSSGQGHSSGSCLSGASGSCSWAGQSYPVCRAPLVKERRQVAHSQGAA